MNDVVRMVNQAQQDRRDAEEHKKRATRRRFAEIAAARRRARRTLHFGSHAFMFLAGVSAALAVHFFVAEVVAGLAMSIVSFYILMNLSYYCDRKYHKKLGKIKK